ncbi:uncharacterized protein CCR75_005703 [Bremia lactucae]|uniref:Uncharacterized protein n=1 Tax=Bremia lactucae TaxID=4779 RepID=A0A976NYB2_BRELC|nr:hypothetical protein CCR75_005703 [Bremia lactucae]
MVAPTRTSQEPVPASRQAYRTNFGRPSRHVPTDKFFADIADAQARSASAAELRTLALREVQRSRVSTDDKVKLFIPASRIAGEYGIDEILHAINREPQSATWDQVLNSLCDFVCVRGHGIRFTCTNRDLAIKIGGTAVSCMGQNLTVKPYSAYERYYYVDLTRIPSDLEEDAIYDYFARLGLQPIVAPTHQAGPLTSRDRTVWFPQTDVPQELMSDGQPLREILFPGFDSPVYVHHKKRSLNSVVPPSILTKRAAALARRRSPSPVTQTSATPPSPPAQPAVSTRPAATVQPPPSPTRSRPLPDGVVILDRPEATAPLQEWVKVSRHALCTGAPTPRPTTLIEQSTTSPTDGYLVFGFPVSPTSFELAFSEHDVDEPTAGDADCVAFDGSSPISCSPINLPESVGSLVAARSLLEPSTNTFSRKEYRSRAKKAVLDLPALSEPEDRVAALTAQPCVYAPFIYAGSDSLCPIVVEHALLRTYSSKPSASHGSDCSFLRRVARDYPGDLSPPASTILSSLFPDDVSSTRARAYALVDLFLRTHAPAIYCDPVKVQALCLDTVVSCYQYSHFLLWTNRTLAELCRSHLGRDFESYLSDHLSSAMRLVRHDVPSFTTTNHSMESSDDASSVATSTDGG